MKNKKFKLTFLGAALCFALVGCSNDDSVDGTNNNNSESGVVTNGDFTLTYGNDLLSKYVEFDNSPINFERVDGASARSINSISSYPYLSNPEALTSLPSVGNVNVLDTQIFVIKANEINQASEIIVKNGGILYLAGSFTGSKIKVENGGKLIITGTYTGNKIHPDSGGEVIVAPTGIFTITGNFNQGTLKNWGNVVYQSGTFDGSLENNNEVTFDNVVNLNGSSTILNNCKLTFKGKATLNSQLVNKSFVKFIDGFMINGSGVLKLTSGSYAKVTGGTYAYDGIIKNDDSSSARLDLLGTKGNINGSNRIMGKIDVNFPSTPIVTLAELQDIYKADNNVTLNGNISILASACTEGAGSSGCNNLQLSFTSIQKFKYPIPGGTTYLSATDVKFENQHAYVSYHTNDAVDNNGNTPTGAIRIFDMTTPGTPVFKIQAESPLVEFNGIDVAGDKLFAVGNNRDGARLVTYDLNSTTHSFELDPITPFITHKLQSSSAKNSYFYNNLLWIASGSTNGGLFTVNTTNGYTDATVTSKTGAKYVANNGVKQAFFAVESTGAYLRIAGLDGSGATEYTYPNLVQNIKDGKNVIAMDDDYVYVSLSDKGVAKINLINGVMEKHFVPNNYRVNGSKVFTKNGATNGVAVDDCYVYLANGADGVIVLNKTDFSPIGSFSISSGSANFVTVSNGYMFVATGRDGLNYIKIN